MMEIRRREVWRYLGYGGNAPQPEEQQKIEAVIAQLERTVTPRHIYLEKPCCVEKGGVEIEGIRFSSALLARNLAGCQGVILMAATLGAEADLQVRRYQARSMAEAAIAQAVCAELLECYLDGVCQEIAGEKEKAGLFLRPRYSPGYGDLALEAQRDFFALLDCRRRLGVSLTDGNMMTPTKSVTAFIGLSHTCRRGEKSGCQACGKQDCAFRNWES